MSKKAATPKKASAAGGSKAMSKTALLSELAEAGEMKKTAAAAVLDKLVEIAVREMKGPASKFTIPGLVQLKLVHVPAKPARMGRNPATGQPIELKPKPATKKVKGRPLKPLAMAVL